MNGFSWKLFFAIFLCPLPVMTATGPVPGGYHVDHGDNAEIDAHGKKKKVTNNHPSGKTIYVPLNSDLEWSTYIASPPPGVTIEDAGCGTGEPITIFLKSGSSWVVPDDWCPTANTIHAIGGGGGGDWSNHTRVAGGGGGAYASISNFAATPGQVINYQVGAGGAAGAVGQPGGDTWFHSPATLLAKGGGGGNHDIGGQGGSAAESVGEVKFSGGNGGNSPANNRGGGGGGAAGPNGPGGHGGNGVTSGDGGGGGGGANGGGNGANATHPNGGAGGKNRFGTGGGAGGTSGGNGGHGSNGGGGGGAAATAYGGNGSQEDLWTQASNG